MKKITRDQALKYEFNWRDDPLIRVDQGESFQLETWDAGSGKIHSGTEYWKVRASDDWQAEPVKGNPIAGPVFVDGAQPGDLLEFDPGAAET